MVKNYQNPQLVGPRRISGSHQQEIHPNFQLPSMELLLMATRNPVVVEIPLFITDFSTIQPVVGLGISGCHQQYGRGPGSDGFHGKNLRPPNFKRGCRSLVGAACRQSWMDQSLGDLVSFWTPGVFGGGTGFFHGFLNLQDGPPKNQLQMGLNLSLEVRFCSPQLNPFAFSHLEEMFHPIETNC